MKTLLGGNRCNSKPLSEQRSELAEIKKNVRHKAKAAFKGKVLVA